LAAARQLLTDISSRFNGRIEFTQRQGVIFRYLAWLLMAAPGATIHAFAAPFLALGAKLALFDC
jgi:hypothetical protein